MPRDPAPSPAHFPNKAPKTEEGRSQKGRVEEVEQEGEEQEEEKQKNNEEEEDWLSGALSRRKALGASQPERRRSMQEESLGRTCLRDPRWM